jgi:hypothetical protein
MIAGNDGGACSSEPGRDRILAILRHRSSNPPETHFPGNITPGRLASAST